MLLLGDCSFYFVLNEVSHAFLGICTHSAHSIVHLVVTMGFVDVPFRLVVLFGTSDATSVSSCWSGAPLCLSPLAQVCCQS